MKKVFLALMLAAWVGWTAKADVTINSSTLQAPVTPGT